MQHTYTYIRNIKASGICMHYCRVGIEANIRVAMNFTMFVCMYVHVYMYVYVLHFCPSHLRSTAGTTENGLHHAYETKEKIAACYVARQLKQ